MCSWLHEATFSSESIPLSHSLSISFCKRVFRNCIMTSFNSFTSSSRLRHDKRFSTSYCAGFMRSRCSILLQFVCVQIYTFFPFPPNFYTIFLRAPSPRGGLGRSWRGTFKKELTISVNSFFQINSYCRIIYARFYHSSQIMPLLERVVPLPPP